MYKGYGVHHIALGVKDLKKMKSFYESTLGFDQVFMEFPKAEYAALQEVVRMPHPVYAAALLNQSAGGIILELVQMYNPVARPIRKDFRYGDIGLSKMTILVSNVEKLFKNLKGRINFCCGPKSIMIPGRGEYRFVYCTDPEGNLIELVTAPKMFVKDEFGGFVCAGISVTHLTRSIAFYQKYAGFDEVFIDIHEGFSNLVDEITFGEKTKVRSCILANSEAEGMIELFEVKKPRGRSIPFASRWGDFGYLQVCLNGKQGDDIFQMASYFKNEGLEFISGPQLMRDEREGAFFYMKDPDGIPVEFLVFLK